MSTLVAYTAVDDVGTMLNPMIVEGQVHGGVVQGVGQALCENGVYDRRPASSSSGSFMDYCMPRADDLPTIDVGDRRPRSARTTRSASKAAARPAPSARRPR